MSGSFRTCGILPRAFLFENVLSLSFSEAAGLPTHSSLFQAQRSHFLHVLFKILFAAFELHAYIFFQTFFPEKKNVYPPPDPEEGKK